GPLPPPGRTRRAEPAGTTAADRAHAPAARAARPPPAPGRRRLQVRLRNAVPGRHRPARPQPDVPAPDPARADHPDRRAAAYLARPLRLPAPRGRAMRDPETILSALCDVIQEDVGCRGLRADPHDNLVTATAGDFAAACRSIADTPRPRLAVVTGFTIPGTTPPTAETDGPPGALFLARALVPIGIGVALAADGTAVPALAAGLAACGLAGQVPLVELPDVPGAYE